MLVGVCLLCNIISCKNVYKTLLL